MPASAQVGHSRTPTRFALTAIAWNLALFATVRTPWIQSAILTPLTDVQKRIADWYVGGRHDGLWVTLDCSGADVMALCLGVTLAYPVAWRARLAAAAGGLALILALNTVRIATLFAAAPSPALFPALHLYIWPAALVLVTAGYVFRWMRACEVGRSRRASRRPAAEMFPVQTSAAWQPSTVRTFSMIAVVGLVVFAVAAPWTMTSGAVAGLAAWTAQVASLLLSSVGVRASAAGAVLSTSGGTFIVTPECIVTPVMPLYVAAVFAAPLTRARRGMALLLALPLFAAFGVARLFLVALPPALVRAPLVLVHGFYQLVTGAALIVATVWWSREKARPSSQPTRWRVAAAFGIALAVAILGGSFYTGAVLAVARFTRVMTPHVLTAISRPDDVQGALGLLPIFQVALLAALLAASADAWRPRRVIALLAVLAASHVALLVVLGELAAHVGFTPHVLAIRGWAVAGPALLVALASRSARHSDRMMVHTA